MKEFLAVIAVVIGIIGYIPYFRTIFSGKTKPHAFTWLVWGVLTAIAFFGQLVGKGGAGAWVTGFTALISFIVFGFALVKGKRDFPKADWLCLAGCTIAMVLWTVTSDPLAAIILVTIIDMLAFIPTFRKSYFMPESEPAFTYALSGLKFLISLFALQEFSTVTVLYPASLVITNALFVAMLYVRRQTLMQS
ncbi:MAG: hypothetical protein NTX11_04870 [Candidatus Saccharibacteria bacterium]|nr:hypothetical protein [Candidatus Saccharibacteria bacterium]